jgi:hypothetical protein
MANCTSCGRELPAFSIGPLSTLCRDCKAMENSPPAIPTVVPSEKTPAAISLTMILVAVNVAVFVLMALTGVSVISPTGFQLVKWGADWGPLSLSTQPWRLLTSNYVHIGIIHIGFNMWCLLSLGALAARVFDRWTYLLIYSVTGIAGKRRQSVVASDRGGSRGLRCNFRTGWSPACGFVPGKAAHSEGCNPGHHEESAHLLRLQPFPRTAVGCR